MLPCTLSALRHGVLGRLSVSPQARVLTLATTGRWSADGEHNLEVGFVARVGPPERGTVGSLSPNQKNDGNKVCPRRAGGSSILSCACPCSCAVRMRAASHACQCRPHPLFLRRRQLALLARTTERPKAASLWRKGQPCLRSGTTQPRALVEAACGPRPPGPRLTGAASCDHLPRRGHPPRHGAACTGDASP